MMLVFMFTEDGGFVAADAETRRTSYAYPTSTHEQRARRKPATVAAEMVLRANRLIYPPDTSAAKIAAEYDARNWAKLTAKITAQPTT